MNLADYIRANNYGVQTGTINWSSPPGPSGTDWNEAYYGFQPVGKSHPPSLRNPQQVSITTPQTGWKKGDSAAQRAQAMQDLVEIHKRMRRQIGKPELAQVASYPVFPNIWQST